MVCFRPVSGTSGTTSAKQILLCGCHFVAQTTFATKSVLSVSGTGGTTSAKYIINSIMYYRQLCHLLRQQKKQSQWHKFFVPIVPLTGITELVAQEVVPLLINNMGAHVDVSLLIKYFGGAQPLVSVSRLENIQKYLCHLCHLVQMVKILWLQVSGTNPFCLLVSSTNRSCL